MKYWEYEGTVYQLFSDSKKAVAKRKIPTLAGYRTPVVQSLA
jgi:hypothetical protein